MMASCSGLSSYIPDRKQSSLDEIVPFPSISNILNAGSSLLSASIMRRLIVAAMNSLKSINPLPSVSHIFMIVEQSFLLVIPISL
jgi:hypothetical protein